MDLSIAGYTCTNSRTLNSTAKTKSKMPATFAEEINNVMSAVSSGAAQQSSGVESIYSKLSASSRSVLQKVGAGMKVTRDEWDPVTRELYNIGAITQEEYNLTFGAKLVPLGYQKSNGDFVTYKNVPGMVDKLREISMQYSMGATVFHTSDGWNGNPLDYLENSMKVLSDWMRNLSVERNEDGSRAYKDFSPISDSIDSKQQVYNLLADLIQFSIK